MTDPNSPTRAFTGTYRSALAQSLLAALIAVLFCVSGPSASAQTQTQTVVQKYGKLHVQGNKIVDQTGTPVQLRGMSLYWSQWIPKYWTASTVKWLRDDWKVTVIRAAMAVNSGGFATNPTVERNKVIAVVDACIQLGVYVVIDYHDHTASDNRALAQAFFSDMAQRYGNSPNVLFETFNEPLNVSWSTVLKPYHQAVISSIRQFAPDSIIICGTRNWSQEVDEAAADPLTGTNIAYTLHFYANTHKQFLRDKAQSALNRGAALFVTEYGTTDATGDGPVNAAETTTWWNFLDSNKVSYANWSVSDIPESSSALIAGASPSGGWTTSQIKPSGLLVRSDLIAKAPNLTGSTPPPPPPIRVTGVTLTPVTTSTTVGGATTLVATVAPATATDKSLTFTSSAPAVATVSTAGVVHGVSAGTATITARTTDGGFTATASVMVTGGGSPGGGATPCSNPVPTTLSMVKNGVGDFCYVTAGNISFINSWSMQLVEINGVVLTNIWSNTMPPRINGNYYIHYVSTVSWSHLEVNGTP